MYTFSDFAQQYLWLFILIGALLLALGVIVGYLIGNVSLRKVFYADFEKQQHVGSVQKLIIENVGLGIITYDDGGVIYANKAISELPGFINDGIPGNLEVFLNEYDKSNHLKSKYLLSLEENSSEDESNVIRVNYVTGNRIYEIKIISRRINIDANGTISNFHIVIVEDITKIKDDERRQKDLAANVSHELKTPLTVIRASEIFVKSLSPNKPIEYAEVKKWGDRIFANALRMQDIVEDFLVLSMCTQTNKMGIFDISGVVKNSIANISDYTNSDKVRIISPKEGAYPLIYGNSKLIVRVITNLLTNALKYIDFDGKVEENEIRIDIVTIDDRIGVQVADNGRGIPHDDIAHLFERFYRVDNSGSRDVGGSGLGLAIAKEISDMHDGMINVVSQPGNGATFTFVLPQAKTVFEHTYEDAKTGVMGEKPYYKAAAEFFATEAAEVVRSRNYLDLNDIVNEWEQTKDHHGENEKKTIRLIAELGDERSADLIDELTFIDDSGFDEDDEELEDEEVIEDNVNEENYDGSVARIEVATELQVQATAKDTDKETDKEAAEPLELTDDEIKRREEQKKIREMLLQPVVQQSVKRKQELSDSASSVAPQKTGENVKVLHTKDKERVMIHPNTENKLYNSDIKIFSTKEQNKKTIRRSEKNKSDNVEPSEEIHSAVKIILDQAPSIGDKNAGDN